MWIDVATLECCGKCVVLLCNDAVCFPYRRDLDKNIFHGFLNKNRRCKIENISVFEDGEMNSWGLFEIE